MRLSRASGPPLKPSASTTNSLSTSRTPKLCSLTTSRPSTILNAFIRLWATSLPSNSKTASSLNPPMLFNQLPVHIFEATSRCCLEKMRVNSVRSAFPELHPLSGLEILKGRQKLIEDLPFGIQGGKRLSTATFPPSSLIPRTTADKQGGCPFYPYPGLKPRAESCSPFGTKIDLNTCPQNRSHSSYSSLHQSLFTFHL